MSVLTPAYRTMGLAVPVTEALDAQLWRERYAYGLILGNEKPVERDSIDAVLGCRGRVGAAKTATGRTETELQSTVSRYADELPNEIIRWHLRVATSEAEMHLGLPFGVVVRKGTPVDPGLVRGQDYDQEIPRRPFLVSDQRDFYRIDLPAGTLSIERVRAFWFGQPVWSVSQADGNGDLIRFEWPGIASMHLLPQQSATLLVAIPGTAGAGYGALQLIAGYPSPLPDVWSVDYTMGPTNRYGQPGEIEAVLAHWIYCRAGKFLFSLAGMRRSRGIVSTSISFDSLSKSISLNQAGLFAALEQRLKDAEDGIDWGKLKLYKKGLRVRPYGG